MNDQQAMLPYSIGHQFSAVPRATADSGKGWLISQGVAVIERNPDLVFQGVDTIEQMPHTLTKGADTIERNVEG